MYTIYRPCVAWTVGCTDCSGRPIRVQDISVLSPSHRWSSAYVSHCVCGRRQNHTLIDMVAAATLPAKHATYRCVCYIMQAYHTMINVDSTASLWTVHHPVNTHWYLGSTKHCFTGHNQLPPTRYTTMHLFSLNVDALSINKLTENCILLLYLPQNFFSCKIKSYCMQINTLSMFDDEGGVL